MAANLHGKTAIVTGGSRGIGAATAKKLAQAGAHVVITYAGNGTAADKTVTAIVAEGVRSEAIRADAADGKAVRAAIDRAAATLGGIDILVHNAGIIEIASVSEATEEDYLGSYRKQFAVNVGGVVAGTAAAIPHLRDGGRVLIIGSVNAHRMPFAGGALYGASKAAVLGLARGWARDLGPRGILVNVIQPGPIDTDMNPDDERDAVKAMTSITALKRYGRVGEIAAVAAFLASDEASYITGTSIDVDGGFSI